MDRIDFIFKKRPRMMEVLNQFCKNKGMTQYDNVRNISKVMGVGETTINQHLSTLRGIFFADSNKELVENYAQWKNKDAAEKPISENKNLCDAINREFINHYHTEQTREEDNFFIKVSHLDSSSPYCTHVYIRAVRMPREG